MNKLLTALTLSLGALMATSAMAAPQYDRHDDRHYSYDQHHSSHWNNQNDRWNNDRYQSKRVNPSRDWRVGQVLPRAYDSSRFQVNYRDAYRLSKPGRYQQWYKINGDYVLVNERNNRIVRIQG